MIFSFKQKSDVKALEDEIAQLKAKNHALETELEQSKSYAQSDNQRLISKQEEYENQSELNKLWMQSADLISHIREALASSSTQLLDHRDNFQSSHELFDQIIGMLQKNIT